MFRKFKKNKDISEVLNFLVKQIKKNRLLPQFANIYSKLDSFKIIFNSRYSKRYLKFSLSETKNSIFLTFNTIKNFPEIYSDSNITKAIFDFLDTLFLVKKHNKFFSWIKNYFSYLISLTSAIISLLSFFLKK